ncbi:MAG: hypothetical protein WA294_10780, partial [Acidobacteriaceae bacterium]
LMAGGSRHDALFDLAQHSPAKRALFSCAELGKSHPATSAVILTTEGRKDLRLPCRVGYSKGRRWR